MKVSERKASAIYSAVHEVVMQARIRYLREQPRDIDRMLYRVQCEAAKAAVEAYRTPLQRKAK